MESSVSSPYSRARLAMACVSIAGNALCGGGIFIFPLISPTLALRLKFTQPQLTTIVLAGLAGQYPLSAFIGKIIDRYGPAACSLIAAALFGCSFSLFALEINRTPEITQPSSASFHRLTFYFLMAGLGTVSSYFSALFAASKLFPNNSGMASGITMSLFGLSPLLLSCIATIFFTTSHGGSLDISSFLNHLAIIAVLVYTIGSLNLRIASNSRLLDLDDHSLAPPTENERTRLLHKTAPGVAQPVDASAWEILRDSNFLLLGVFCLLTLGAAEMVISNIGTILLSLPNTSPTNPIADTAPTQVRLLSISNTVSRILVGPLADAISPAASFTSISAVTTPKKHGISRIVFLTGPALLLAASFLWMELCVTSQEAIWVLSVGTGIGYGAIFTVLPSIISILWGQSNLGRNFGIATYAPFIGTPLFSYLYAFVSASHSHDQAICEGQSCWRLTFWVSCLASIAATAISIVIWRRCAGRV